MTQLRERVAEIREITRDSASYMYEWIAGVVGGLTALIGAWMYWAPSADTLSLFRWDWDVSGLAEAWPFGLMVAGGLLLLGAFGSVARKIYRIDGDVTLPVVTASVLSLLALAGVVAIALLWIF